jgi:hypothetical protein
LLGRRVLGVSVLVVALWVVPTLGRVSVVPAVVAGLGLVACGIVCLAARARVSYQLSAVAAGRAVVLLETDDRLEVEQVVRGLRRAIDYRADRT